MEEGKLENVGMGGAHTKLNNQWQYRMLWDRKGVANPAEMVGRVGFVNRGSDSHLYNI